LLQLIIYVCPVSSFIVTIYHSQLSLHLYILLSYSHCTLPLVTPLFPNSHPNRANCTL